MRISWITYLIKCSTTSLTYAQLLNTENIQIYQSPKPDISYGFAVSFLTPVDDLISVARKINKAPRPDNNEPIHSIIGAPRDLPTKDPDLKNVWRGNQWAGSLNFCYSNIKTKKLDCVENRRSFDKQVVTNFPNKGDKIAVRYDGLHINFNKNLQTLITCAPASQFRNTLFNNTGFCQKFTNKNDLPEQIILQSDTYYHQPYQAHKMFGTHSVFLDNSKDKILFNAPTAWNERGYLTMFDKNKSQTRQKKFLLKPMEDQKSIRDKEVPDHNGWAIQEYKCKNNGQKFIAAANMDARGKIAIYRYDRVKNSKTRQTEETIIKTFNVQASDADQASTFGERFGFAMTTVKLNRDNPYLLISAPYGVYGKLYLLNGCSLKFENHRLKNIPKNIKSFGYSIENIGNFDQVQGDEILIGAPNENQGKGSITILGSRNDQYLTFLQKFNPSENFNINHLGLALSKITRNIDNLAGDDLLVSGDNAIAIIFSEPFYTLVNDIMIIFEVENENKIQVFNHNKYENITVCLDLRSNLSQKQREIAFQSVLTLDSLRQSQSVKRYKFLDNRFTKLLQFEQDKNLKNPELFCSEKMTIKATSPNNWSCNQNCQIYTPIQFQLSDLKRSDLNSKKKSKSGKLEKSEKMNILPSSYNLYKNITPVYICSGKNNCIHDLKLTELSDSGEAITKIYPTAGQKSFPFTVKIQNQGNYKIYGTVIQFNTNNYNVEVASSSSSSKNQNSCYEIEQNIYNCHINCPILPKNTQTYTFDINFNQILAYKEFYHLDLGLLKDGSIIKSSKYRKTFQVITKIDSDLMVGNRNLSSELMTKKVKSYNSLKSYDFEVFD